MPASQAAPTRSPGRTAGCPGRVDHLGHDLVAGGASGRVGGRSPSARCRSVRHTPQQRILHQQLARAGVGDRPFDQAQRAGADRPGLMDYPCTHGPTIRERLGSAARRRARATGPQHRVKRATTLMVAGPRSMPIWFQVQAELGPVHHLGLGPQRERRAVTSSSVA